MSYPPKKLFPVAWAVRVVYQKKLSTFCDSGLDQARPVLNTGESVIFGLSSRRSLPHNESAI
jgi:hypothetical protein